MTTSGFSLDVAWAADVPALRDDGLRATFAELTIRCGTEIVTRHVNGPSVLDSLYIPVAPLATWLARCWPDLMGGAPPFALAESSDAHRALGRIDDDAWDAGEVELERWLRAHALRFVGDGLFLPDLVLWRIGDVMSLSWRAFRPGSGVEFLGGDHVEIPVRDFVDEVRRFVRDVAERIASADERSASRAELERAESRMRFPWKPGGLRLVSSRLGRSPEDVRAWLEPLANEEQRQRAVAEAYGVDRDDTFDPAYLDSPVLMAARSAGPRFTLDDHGRMIALARKLPTLAPAEGIRDLRDRLGPTEPIAYPRAADGYRRADAVRAIVARTTRCFEIDRFLERRGCVIVDEPLDDRRTDGLVLWTPDERVLLVANTESPRTATPWGRRAMLAHELYHLLFDTADVRFFGEATTDGAATPSEPAANAFAAELLLPERYLPKSVSHFWTNSAKARADVDKLCEDFDIGWELVVRQLQNHRHLPPAVVEALLGEHE